MNTATRRQRLLDLLHQGTTTVPKAAEVLGISERTAYRDVSALRDQGYSIRATSGPGGGVALDLDSRPRPVHFEVGEILGLALSVAILQATPGMPFASSAESALNRARRALSRERQRSMQRLQRRILVGDAASDSVRDGLGPVDADLLGVFEDAFTHQRAMSFDYVDRFGTPTQRTAECVALLLRHPAWYVVAWDLVKDAPRMFRMDRMRAATAGAPLAASHSLASVLDIVCPVAEAVDTSWLGSPLDGSPLTG